MPGLVGPSTGLCQQRLPRLVRQAVPVPVRARVLTPVVEEADVVVLLLQRADLRLDEGIQLREELLEVGGKLCVLVDHRSAVLSAVTVHPMTVLVRDLRDEMHAGVHHAIAPLIN